MHRDHWAHHSPPCVLSQPLLRSGPRWDCGVLVNKTNLERQGGGKGWVGDFFQNVGGWVLNILSAQFRALADKLRKYQNTGHVPRHLCCIASGAKGRRAERLIRCEQSTWQTI